MIEFLGWKEHTGEGFKKAKEFLDNANIIYINKNIAEKTIEIRKKYSIKLADALLAATSIENKFTLITRNETDFKNIDLKISVR